jgi:hypothetical protein
VSSGKTDVSWLGAEALPGDLAEINRVYQTMQEVAARRQKSPRTVARRGLLAIAMRWLKPRPLR